MTGSSEYHGVIGVDRIHGKIDEDLLLCSICHNVLWNPVACKSCENAFCTLCIHTSLKEKNNYCPFNCYFEERKCPPCISILLSKLQIDCCYKLNGCTTIVSYERLDEHEEECNYQPLECEKCHKQMLKQDFEQHQQECELIDLTCNECHVIYKRKDLNQHTEIECLQNQFEQQQQMIEKKMNENEDIVKNMEKETQHLVQSQMTTMDTKLELVDEILRMEHETQQNEFEQKFQTQQDLFDEKQKLMEKKLNENDEKYNMMLENIEEEIQQIRLLKNDSNANENGTNAKLCKVDLDKLSKSVRYAGNPRF
ncbi:unnamed protein product [Didymodactylos carnosus]|uniref:TRAF-type domain-containing protein n=2 Tax=Didymodactylos carnosus TaxID=1234261 RepID=A0A815XKQ4_9BILA|nr:unnamed protein product [Didymodactylos carnosus]CAF4420159.1 unnamed protein product [Didymodactylos carnosus]